MPYQYLFPVIIEHFVLLPISAAVVAIAAIKLRERYAMRLWQVSLTSAGVGTVSYLSLLFVFSTGRDLLCQPLIGAPKRMELCVHLGFGWM